MENIEKNAFSFLEFSSKIGLFSRELSTAHSENSKIGRLNCFFEFYASFHIVCDRYTPKYAHFTNFNPIWPLSKYGGKCPDLILTLCHMLLVEPELKITIHESKYNLGLNHSISRWKGDYEKPFKITSTSREAMSQNISRSASQLTRSRCRPAGLVALPRPLLTHFRTFSDLSMIFSSDTFP